MRFIFSPFLVISLLISIISFIFFLLLSHSFFAYLTGLCEINETKNPVTAFAKAEREILTAYKNMRRGV
jgi:hypothetical protein